jgi:hypothetical protein
MGFMPVGIGWANHSVTRGNFIYIHGYAPTRRSDEYERKSGIAGMRVTNYGEDTFYDDRLFEDNVIVLKAEDGCTQARGIWTSNNLRDSRIVYRRNTVKVEAMAGNAVGQSADGNGFYGNDVNNAVTAVSVCDDEWERPADGSEGVPGDIVFEENRFVGNVNLVVLGEGYGIGSSVRMVGCIFEKIGHDSDWFRPVRLGFWYWNTFNNRLVDCRTVNFDVGEMAPHFFGDRDGVMEVSYGVVQSVKVVGNGVAMGNTVVTVVADGGYPVRLVTDAGGRLVFDRLTVRHLCFKGAESVSDYGTFVFTVAGFRPCIINVGELAAADEIRLVN